MSAVVECIEECRKFKRSRHRADCAGKFWNSVRNLVSDGTGLYTEMLRTRHKWTAKNAIKRGKRLQTLSSMSSLADFDRLVISGTHWGRLNEM